MKMMELISRTQWIWVPNVNHMSVWDAPDRPICDPQILKLLIWEILLIGSGKLFRSGHELGSRKAVQSEACAGLQIDYASKPMSNLFLLIAHWSPLTRTILVTEWSSVRRQRSWSALQDISWRMRLNSLSSPGLLSTAQVDAGVMDLNKFLADFEDEPEGTTLNSFSNDLSNNPACRDLGQWEVPFSDDNR